MVRPKRHSRPGYGSPGENTHNRTALSFNRRPINRRHTNRRKSPMSEYPMLDYPTPATPTSISLEIDVGPSNLPKDQPGIGETTYETSGSFLCTGGVLLAITQLGRVSLIRPYNHMRFYLLTPDSAEYWMACADRPHNPL